MPGPVTSPLAETPLALIRDGAVMVRGADDLLHDLGLANGPCRLARRGPIGLPTAGAARLDALEAPMLPDAVASARRAGHRRGRRRRSSNSSSAGSFGAVGGRYERTFERSGRPGPGTVMAASVGRMATRRPSRVIASASGAAGRIRGPHRRGYVSHEGCPSPVRRPSSSRRSRRICAWNAVCRRTPWRPTGGTSVTSRCSFTATTLSS